MRRTTVRLLAVTAVVLLALVLAGIVISAHDSPVTTTTVGAVHGGKIIPNAEALDAGASGCGVERAAVKHLTDGFTLPSTPTVETIEKLTGLAAPAVTQDSPRFPIERELVQLQNVHVVAAKREADSDLHVILATSTGAEMNVESPQAQCDSSSPVAGKLAAARAALDAALGNVSSTGYTPENLQATIEGVLFFDVLHGQRGAPNGVELHPVTSFVLGSGPPPPPPPPPPVSTTTPTTTTTPTSTTKDDALDELPGCATYPRRIYLHHVKQSHCAKAYFTTP